MPENHENDTHKQERKSREQKAMIAGLSYTAQLALTVLRIGLVLGSSHGNKGQHHISHNESNAEQSALAADKLNTGKKQEQNARHRKAVRKDLKIYLQIVGKEAVNGKHGNCDANRNANAYEIFDKSYLVFLFHDG